MAVMPMRLRMRRLASKPGLKQHGPAIAKQASTLDRYFHIGDVSCGVEIDDQPNVRRATMIMTAAPESPVTNW